MSDEDAENKSKSSSKLANSEILDDKKSDKPKDKKKAFNYKISINVNEASSSRNSQNFEDFAEKNMNENEEDFFSKLESPNGLDKVRAQNMNFSSQNPKNFLGNSVSFHESQIMKRSGNLLSETEITPEEKEVFRQILEGNYQPKDEDDENQSILIPEEAEQLTRFMKDEVINKQTTNKLKFGKMATPNPSLS